MRILLLDYFQYGSDVSQRPALPVGLLSLAAVLKKGGHHVEIISIDYLLQKKVIALTMEPDGDFRTIGRYLLTKNPDVVGFSTVCSSFHNALLLSRALKELDGNVKIMLGGPHASTLPEKILATFPWIDVICVGEAETSISAIVDGLMNGNLSDAAGAVYRRGGEVMRNKAADLIADLDTLPLPDYDLLPYFADLAEIAIETGRGCPYGCIYCSTSAYWQHRFRVKSAKRICAEIRRVKERFPGRPFHFVHDNFTTNYELTMNLCEQLRQLGIIWTCNARIDTLDEPLIKKMAASGCRGMLIGLETGSPRMQKYIGKNLQLAVLDNVTDLLKKYAIRPIASFMFGFPGETEEDLAQTFNVMLTLWKKGVPTKFFALSLIAGTKIMAEHQDQLVLREYSSNMNQFISYGLPREWVKEHKDLFSHYYTLNGSLTERHYLLDKFINFILSNFYCLFPHTITKLLDIFAGNLFALYEDFLSVKGETMAGYFQHREYVKGMPVETGFWKQMLALLTEYIQDKALQDFRYKMIARELCAEKDWLENYLKSTQKKR